MAYGLMDLDAVVEWTEADEARPNVDVGEVPAQLSERARRVLKGNPKLRGLFDESVDGFPSDSERANSLMWHAGFSGLSKEDAARLMLDFYTKPGKKRLHRVKLEKTLRAWQKGWEEAERQEAAYHHTPERDDGPPPDDPGVETVVDAEPEATAKPKEAPKTKTQTKMATAALPYEMLPLAEYRTAKFAGARQLVPSLGLIEQGVGVLAAPGGHGKSVAMLNLICGWAGAKIPLADAIPASRCLRIVGFQVENPAGIEQERVNRILCTPESPEGVFLFTRTEPIRFSGARGKPNLMALARLEQTLSRHAPIDLVTFDPLIHLHEAEENSASEMTRWLVPLREVCRKAGASILIVHHAGWAADGEDARGRGSTAIRAWSDFELALRRETRNEKTLYRMNLVKANFAPLWKQHLTLEFDEDTCLFHPVDEGATLCSPDALVAWMVEDLNGIWTDKRADLYEAICKRFGCSNVTARRAIATAIGQGKLRDQGQRKPLEVVSNSQETLI